MVNGKTSAFDTTVSFTLGGTATEGTDYATVTKTVTIPAGQTSATFVVDPTSDHVYEGKETVVATLTAASTNGAALSFASGALGSSVATGTIDDDFTTATSDKPIIGISVNPTVVDEDGAANLTIRSRSPTARPRLSTPRSASRSAAPPPKAPTMRR